TGKALPGKFLTFRPMKLISTAETASAIPQMKKRVSLLIGRAELYPAEGFRRSLGSGCLNLGHRRRLDALLCGRHLPVDPEGGADLAFNLRRQLRVVGQELLGVVAALAEAGLAIGEERARF